MRLFYLVGAEGFEPSTFCSRSKRATRLRYAPTSGTSYEVKVADSIRFPRRKVNGETSAAKVEVYAREAGKEAVGVDVEKPELESFMVFRQVDESELKSA